MIAPGIPEVTLPLDLLKTNEAASVIEMNGNEGQIHRLSEMGLRVGVSVRMVRPGSPCLLALEGKRLSVRLGHDIDILVAAEACG